MTSQCRVCKSPLQPGLFDNLSGKSGDISINFTNFPYVRCPSGHQKKFPDPEFPLALLIAVSRKIPRARSEGLMHKRLICLDCRKPIETQPQEAEFSILIQLDDLRGIKLEAFQGIVNTLKLPAVTCPSCGTRQSLPDRHASSLADTMISAFDSEKLER